MGDEANACVHNDHNDIQIKYSRWFLLSNTPTRCLLRSVPKVGASALNVYNEIHATRLTISYTHTHTSLTSSLNELEGAFRKWRDSASLFFQDN